MAETIRFEWKRVIPGAYAMGAYRVQGSGKHWRWWHVVQLTPGAPRGSASSRTAAMAGAEADFLNRVPTLTLRRSNDG